MNLSAKIFLEEEEQYVLGPGRVELLRSINELGSLRKAAQKLGMSYRWAWGRLNDAEKALGTPLLAHDGTRSGKAKSLTPAALALLAWYDSVNTDVKTVLDNAMANMPEFLQKQPARKKSAAKARSVKNLPAQLHQEEQRQAKKCRAKQRQTKQY